MTGTRRRLGAVLAVLVVLVVLASFAALPVLGHGNHLTTDAQVVDDHVVVERSFVLQDGYAVVHIDQGGRMGRAIGHTELTAGQDENYEIPVDETFLSQIDGDARVWVVLHRSDGDGEFEPNEDTPLTGLQGRAAGVSIPIRVSDDGNVNVVAREFSNQRIDESRVTVRRVESNASGFVAVSANGTVLGSAPVDAGTNRNVSVPIDEGFYESLALNESATLTATVHRDDDGEFDASTDRPVMAGGEPVSSGFGVAKVRNASRTTSVFVTATRTTARSTTDDGDGASDGSSTASSTEPSGPTPGFELVVGALAALAALLVVARRSRR